MKKDNSIYINSLGCSAMSYFRAVVGKAAGEWREKENVSKGEKKTKYIKSIISSQISSA